MKPRPAPAPLNSLALAFAACAGFPAPPPSAAAPRPYRKEGTAATQHRPTVPTYPVQPWRMSTPIIKPPPPLLPGTSWAVETRAEEKTIYLESKTRRKKNGEPETMRVKLITHHATVTSASGAVLEFSALPGKGSTILRLTAADLAAREHLRGLIAAIEAAPAAIKPAGKRSKERPCLSDHQRAEIRLIRAQIAALGSRHLPMDVGSELAAKLGPVRAAETVAFLLP